MHLVCSSVMKKLLLFPKEGPRLCKLSSRHINRISEKLEQLKRQCPSEMARQLRGLNDVKKFKATEFRMFLLETGISTDSKGL